MAEIGRTPVSGYRDTVDGTDSGRNGNRSACAIRARDPHHQCASSNPGETGAASRAEPHQHSPRNIRGIDGTRRPRHPAVHSTGKADLRPRRHIEHQGGSCPGLRVQRQLHLADNLRPTRTRYPLKTAIGMQMANGDKAQVDHFVRPVLRIGDLRAILAPKVFDTPIPMIPGYHFLRMLRVKPDWTTRKVELSHRGLTYACTLGHD